MDNNGPIKELSDSKNACDGKLKMHSRYNVFGRTSIFIAQVISEPRAFSGADSEAAGGTKEGEDPVGLYICNVMLLSAKMSHIRFFKNPCLISIVTEEDAAAVTRLRSLFTRMTISVVGDVAPPQIDDIVEIALEPGDNNCPYNLQIGKFVKMREVLSAAETQAEPQCVGLGDLFGAIGGAMGRLGAGGFSRSGTKSYSLDSSVCDSSTAFYLMHPLGGTARISSTYGPRKPPVPGASSFHKGTDMPAKIGTPVYAAARGILTKKAQMKNGKLSGAGYYVKIKHDKEQGGAGYETKYFHLARMSHLANGAEVQRGDLVGYAGNTGVGSGPHLHFELWKGGKAMDAIPNIKTLEKCPVSATSAPEAIAADSVGSSSGSDEDPKSGVSGDLPSTAGS
tara:strand:- start:839 stop:2023 length:1185 start_codon:yes stop_codon:yes gene_type:complete